MPQAPVAQWIERQPPELKAAGSIPAGRTIIKTRAYELLMSPFFLSKILAPDTIPDTIYRKERLVSLWIY
jgi:hypothetical protein